MDALGHDAVDLRQRGGIEFPAHDLGDRIELIGVAGAPERDAERLLVEHPAHRQMQDALAVILAGEGVEPRDRIEILLEAQGLEL